MRFYILGGLIVGLAVAHDINTQVKTRTTGKLYLEVIEKFEEIEVANEAQIKYLCHLLEQHDVPVDEFDLIALSYHL